MGGGLAPAAERIRTSGRRHDDPLGRALRIEVADVEATLKAADPAAFEAAVKLLADRRRRVVVVAGDAEGGIATTFADQLDQLREGVETLGGAPPRVARRLAHAGPADIAVAVDVRRYDTWLLEAVGAMRAAGAAVVAVTDGPLSPLVPGAAAWFEVVAEGTGPFDSHVGTLALLHALVAGVADRLRGPATGRLDRIEAAWRQTGALSD
jgi:DNA-binding MurR/RpiR family transcriptional regulator